ncbi:hypothetical protein [Caloramator sp. Dgby_cultured_2]|uniref:hypothetical protein n=1 Tax=Caloramator sp. Dgby_cultured_2 TaxID=3029174 RepID=UPI00237E8CC3|nr:hypothetical protein [Caloramator sp. Dgby_cultured_2]WDU83437.1 hypothetical protein PWK10_01730 [Caloramator sp. Dgby_cultured_2]
MKKLISMLLVLLLTVSVFSGCGKTEEQANSNQTGEKVLKIWSFTDEIKTMAVAYRGNIQM